MKAALLKKAEFNPKLKTYVLWYGVLVCTISLVLIPLIPIWLIAASMYLKRYFSHLECELTERSLRFKKGYIFQTERTIPLDKIQDLTFKEGPLLKHFGLSILRIETAGNAGPGTADLSLIGIVDAFDFRAMVFEQRDKVTDNKQLAAGPEDHSSSQTLTEIRDILVRIENKLK